MDFITIGIIYTILLFSEQKVKQEIELEEEYPVVYVIDNVTICIHKSVRIPSTIYTAPITNEKVYKDLLYYYNSKPDDYIKFNELLK